MSKTVCIRCKGWPCVCDYITKIAKDESLLGQIARGRTDEWMQEKHRSRLECPCVECYRARLASWEVES